jgi:hypothetical protein
MAPDLPLFAPIGVPYGVTHRLWAAPTLDALLGLLLLILWNVVLRPAVVAVLPPAVSERTPGEWARPTVTRPGPAMLAALAVGGLTHVVWDAFTHRGRWGTALVPVLQATVAGVPLASWAQYASSLLAILLLAAWGWRRLRRAARSRRPAVLGTAPRRILAATVVAALAAGAAGAGSAHGGSGAPAVAFAAATGGIDAAGAVLIVLGVALGFRPTTP